MYLKKNGSEQDNFFCLEGCLNNNCKYITRISSFQVYTLSRWGIKHYMKDVILVLFSFSFPVKVAMGHTHSSLGLSPVPVP